MIDVVSISGEILCTVPVLKEAVSHEELMVSDYVQLAWSSDRGDILPVGCYITHEGEKYSLLKDYVPARANEAEYKYTPQFQSRIMRWQKTILPVYTYGNDGEVTRRELDWTYTGTPSDAMYMVQQALQNELGEKWSIVVEGDYPETITVTSQSSSIWSVLSDIAEQCNTEWYADKPSNYLYLKKCIRGVEVGLEVGGNVKVPSVTASQEEYYTRFYAFGSTRNVTQSEGVVMGSIINKRLTLDPVKYPDGYKDIRGHFENGRFVSDLHSDEVFAIPLYFEDIYPSSPLVIANARKRMRYHLEDDRKIKIGGTEENPEYSQYAIWYFQIPDFKFTEEMIVEGQELSVHFKSGQLRGREFTLAYHSEDKVVADKADVDAKFAVKAGEYEIIFDEQTEGFIIPSADYLIPQDDDEIILFNINLPEEYTQSAMVKLEEELDKEIAKRLRDNNSYEFSSNPVAFSEGKTDVSLGQRVRFVNNGAVLETRVLMVEKRLDFPFEQKIRVGNEVIVGSRQQLKDEVREVGREVSKMREVGTNSTFIQRDHSRDLMRTMGRYFAMQDTIKMLEDAIGGYSEAIDPITIRTMAMLVGDESLQFRFTQSRDNLTPLDACPVVYNPETKMLDAAPCALIHLTLGIDAVTAKGVRTASDYYSWDMEDWHSDAFEDAEKAYYVYAVVPRTAGGVGSYTFKDKPIGMEEVEGCYHFLIGILNSEYADTRELVTLYGFTAVLPAQVTTDMIRSADGSCYFDLAKNEIGGVIRFTSGSSGELNIGTQNLLRNSGFTGDYLSETLADDSVLDAVNEMYNPPLVHWDATSGVTLVDVPDVSASGRGVHLEYSYDRLSQKLYSKTIVGESYILSFKAKADYEESVVEMECGGMYEHVAVTSEWKRYVVKFAAIDASDVFMLEGSGYTVCELQLERGTIATAWSPSYLDNMSDRAYYQSLKFIEQALNEGSTTVGGGLVLTNHIKVGNYANKEMIEETGGMQGTYQSEHDPFLWGGGGLDKAIETIKKYKENPSYQPSDEELSEMANFVVTHGGRAILNDAVVKGTIYAQNGVFGGRLQLGFKEIEGTHTLSVDDSSSLWLRGIGQDAVLTLPVNDAFDGWQLNVFAYPVVLKGDGQPYINGSILCPHKTDSRLYYASQIHLPNGGYLQFTYRKGWVLINDQSAGAEYTREGD